MRCDAARVALGRTGAVSMKTLHELKLEGGFVFNYLGDLFAPGFAVSADGGGGSPAGFFALLRLAKAGNGSDLWQWRQEEKGSEWEKKQRSSLCACRPLPRYSLFNVFFFWIGNC